jgi:hypothetical protein
VIPPVPVVAMSIADGRITEATGRAPGCIGPHPVSFRTRRAATRSRASGGAVFVKTIDQACRRGQRRRWDLSTRFL